MKSVGTYALSVLLVVIRAAFGGETISIVLSSDHERRSPACHACKNNDFSSHLIRLATIVRRLKQDEIFAVDTGNVRLSAATSGSEQSMVVLAYNKADYDAVNLSYRDFRRGRTQTLRMLGTARFAAVSANLVDSENGKTLAKPFVVKEEGSSRVAFVGVTQRPAALDVLPHLKKQLSGIHIRPPTEALKEWLPAAKAAADHVILLYYGTPAGLWPLFEEFGNDVDAILVGGTYSTYLPKDTKPPIVSTRQRGRTLAVLRMTGPPGNVTATVQQLPIEPSIKPDPEMKKLLGAFK